MESKGISYVNTFSVCVCWGGGGQDFCTLNPGVGAKKNVYLVLRGILLCLASTAVCELLQCGSWHTLCVCACVWAGGGVKGGGR